MMEIETTAHLKAHLKCTVAPQISERFAKVQSAFELTFSLCSLPEHVNTKPYRTMSLIDFLVHYGRP